jgi:endonuclease-3
MAKPAPHADLPFALPQVTASQKRRASQVADALAHAYPHAHCELNYSTPHELLVATILSAQATDAGVNKATPALFKKFPTPAAYAASSPAEIEPFIKTIGLFRNKAKAIHAAMKDVAEKHHGEVPRVMDDLLALRGVARKTANVVLGNAFNINLGFVVDTHIERVSKRFGLVDHDASVQMTERKLMALFPREKWCQLSHQFIFHGRYACKARGVTCADNAICTKFGTACECRNAPAPAATTRRPSTRPTTRNRS